MRSVKLRLLGTFAAVIMIHCTASRVLAEHFAIDLTLEAGRDRQEAHADTAPPPQGTHLRPVCHCKRDEPFSLQFFVTSNFPHDVKRNVTVQYFIAPEEKPGQAAVPDIEP